MTTQATSEIARCSYDLARVRYPAFWLLSSTTISNCSYIKSQCEQDYLVVLIITNQKPRHFLFSLDKHQNFCSPPGLIARRQYTSGLWRILEEHLWNHINHSTVQQPRGMVTGPELFPKRTTRWNQLCTSQHPVSGRRSFLTRPEINLNRNHGRESCLEWRCEIIFTRHAV